MANPENKIEKDIQNEIPKENKMGVMPVGKLLFTMSLPIMISMLVQALYNVVDSMFVARVSENALTALSIAFPIQNLMIAVSVGLGVGLNAVVSRALGAKDTKGVNRAATNGIMLMFICGLLFMLGGATLVRPYFEMQTDIEEIVTSGIDYTSIVMMGSMGVFMQILFERLLQSTGRTMLTMFSQGIGAIINIIFDPIFIFGYFGFPKMGVAGAAYATVLGQWIAALLGLILNIRMNPEVSINMKGFRPHGATIRLILSIGIPSVVMQSIGSVMTFLMNQILIAKNTIQYSVYAAIVIMICGALIFQSIPDKLLMLFDASDEMLRVGVPALRIISLSFPLAGFGIGAGAVFQALGFSVYSMIISLIRQLVVLIPCAYLIGMLTGDVTGVWWAFVVAEVVSLTVSALYLRRVNRDVIQTL